jgi:hypothetical protein
MMSGLGAYSELKSEWKPTPCNTLLPLVAAVYYNDSSNHLTWCRAVMCNF